MFETKVIDSALNKYLPRKGILAEAMRYSVFAGGKRLRPILMLEAARICGGKLKEVLPAACAVEMIHTFTLVHDDLPAMDNSDLRRGLPTCHKVFSEEIAILAGDALNTLAFEVLARHCKADKVARVTAELAQGLRKVVEGQVLDLSSESKRLNVKQLRELHLKKTAALIEAAVRIGAFLARARDPQVKALTRYARHLGLAFQITDDILDVTSKSEILGKPAGADQKARKATYPGVLGLKKAQMLAEKHRRSAIQSLTVFGKRANTLKVIADFVVRRKK